MKYTISSPQNDNYQIYATERECYAIRSTGNLYLRAMVPYRYQAPQSRTGSFNRDDMNPAYGNLDYLKKPHPKEELTCDRAAIIYFEGSGFMGVENFNGYPSFTDIVRENIVFICCDYRGAGLDDERFPCNIEDAKEAIRYVRKNAARFGIDENKIFVMGCSSGGYTATMAGITSEDEFICGNDQDISSKVAGIIDCFGPTDFVNEPDDRKAIGKVTGELPEEAYSLFRNDPVEDPELLKTASVVYRINDNDIPPIMICHGNKDRTVPYRQSERLYEVLTAHNKEVLFYTVDGGGLGVDFWSDALIKEIIRFMKEKV